MLQFKSWLFYTIHIDPENIYVTLNYMSTIVFTWFIKM